MNGLHRLKEDLINKLILDAGCGIGRNSYYCLKNGAKEVHLFDVEVSTVEIAKDNLKDFNNISIFKDSIYDQESVVKNSYDLVMSIGDNTSFSLSRNGYFKTI